MTDEVITGEKVEITFKILEKGDHKVYYRQHLMGGTIDYDFTSPRVIEEIYMFSL